MANFLEKLKKGMEINELPKEAMPEEIKREEINPKKTEKFETSKKEPAEENNWLEEEGQLAIDVYQTEKEIVVQSAIAGVKPEDLDILVENDIVLIRGSRPKPMEKENQNYFYQECPSGIPDKNNSGFLFPLVLVWTLLSKQCHFQLRYLNPPALLQRWLTELLFLFLFDRHLSQAGPLLQANYFPQRVLFCLFQIFLFLSQFFLRLVLSLVWGFLPRCSL